MVNAWKNMLYMYGDLTYSYNDIDISYYLHNSYTFDKYSVNYDTYNDRPSAFNFINAHRNDYDDWVFSPLMQLNEFGL